MSISPTYLLMLLQGFVVSISVGLLAYLSSLLFGALLAWGRLRGPKALARAIALYCACFRGVPEIVTILLVYYGLPTLMNRLAASMGFETSFAFPPFLAGALTLAMIYAAFCAEVLRGAALSVPKGQYEAAAALALPRKALILRAIGPQILVRALPGLSNVWLVMLKATALMSVIQLEEIMRMAQIASRATKAPFIWFFLASLCYLAVTALSIWAASLIEKRSARALGRG